VIKLEHLGIFYCMVVSLNSFSFWVWWFSSWGYFYLALQLYLFFSFSFIYCLYTFFHQCTFLLLLCSLILFYVLSSTLGKSFHPTFLSSSSIFCHASIQVNEACNYRGFDWRMIKQIGILHHEFHYRYIPE
jgi:hypothetical protein